MTKSLLERKADLYHRALLRRERKAASALVQAYGTVWQRVKGDLEAATHKETLARRLRQPVSPAWAFQRERAMALKAQIEAELRTFGDDAAAVTRVLQRDAITAAGQHAAGLVDLAAGKGPPGVTMPFNMLPREAMQEMIGFASDGSPLREVYDRISRGTAELVVNEMVAGIAAGLNPRQTARRLRRAFGTGLAKSLVVARTETMRAYREATHRNFEANKDVLEGWIWLSALGTRTCAACWAMHGSFHRLDERLNDHPNGRCTQLPYVKSWRALGFNVPDTRPDVTPGPDLFDQLSEAEQQAILGKAAFAAYQDGAIRLGDLAAYRQSDVWGPTLRRRSLREVLGPKAAKYIRGMKVEPPPPPPPPPVPPKPKPKLPPPPAAVPAAPPLPAAKPKRKSSKPYDLSEGTRVRQQIEREVGAVEQEIYTAQREIDQYTLQIERIQADYTQRWIDAKARNAKPAELSALIDEQMATIRPLQAQRDEVFARRNKLFQDRDSIFVRHLEVLEAERSSVSLDVSKVKGTGSKKVRSQCDEALDFVNRVTSGSQVQVQVIAQKGRAYATPGKICIDPGGLTQTIIHEIGHNIEYTRGADARKKRMAFFDDRTKGDRLEKLSALTGISYRDDEKAKRDKWLDVYMGKVYTHDADDRASSELISMGIEELYHNPANLMTGDPEYFDFVVSWLRGTL